MAASTDHNQVESVLQSVLPVFNVQKMKPEQEEILWCLLDKQDCLAVLPTGYGKSLPYQILTELFRKLFESDLDQLQPILSKHNPDPIVVVCCPLISLMNDQVDKLRTASISAGYVGEHDDVDAEVEAGNVSVVYGSPENLVGNKKWREWLQSTKERISTIVIDEFHTIASWGGKADSAKAFREWFRHVGQLKSLIPNASLLALSATCTKEVRKRVTSVLSMEKGNYKFLYLSPNKENIKYMVKKIEKDVASKLCWVVDAMEDDASFPKTVCYASSIAKIGEMHRYPTSELPEFKDQIQMFHSKTPECKKQEIIKNLTSDSDLKIVLCTNALGMGIDIKGCHNVIHFDPPRTISDFLQETGRVGRDGELSFSCLMYTSLRNADLEMKAFVNDTKCRRLVLMGFFVSKKELDELKKRPVIHTCCDLCAASCVCGKCDKLGVEKYIVLPDQTSGTDSDEEDEEDTVSGKDMSLSEISSDEFDSDQN